MSQDVEKYQRLINTSISYIKNGKLKSGKLISIKSDDPSGQLLAVIHSGSSSPPVFVPLNCVLLPKPSSSSSSNWKQAYSQSPVVTRPQLISYPEYFIYNLMQYNKCEVPWLKLGEEVVWLLPERLSKSNPESPYIGRIKFLGSHQGVIGDEQRIAVVEFDEKTDHLSGFIALNRRANSVIYTNAVNVNQLVDLHKWLYLSCKPEESLNDSFDSEESAGYKAESAMSLNTIPKPLEKSKVPIADLIDLDDGVENMFVSNFFKPPTYNGNKSDWRAVIDMDHLLNTIIMKPNRLFGIQGYNNSCYMDSVLFALFSFCHALDDLISLKKSEISQLPNRMKTELRENIVCPLRTQYYVPFQNTQTLRQILGNANTNFLKSHMDAEDFILTLFELLDAPPMFKYDNGVEDYVHQIFLPLSLNPFAKISVLTVQSLLNGSFKASDVKLLQPPPGLFIVKMPVSDGVLIPCDRVVPDLQLDLTGILSEHGHSKREGKTMLSLSAVICFKQNHYVTFVRTGRDVESPWVFMDSRPTDRKPYVRVLKYTGTLLKKLLDKLHDEGTEMIRPPGIPEDEVKFATRIITDAYICIYENVFANDFC